MSERDLNKVVKFAKRKSSGAFNGNLVEFLKNKKQIPKGHFKTELREFHDKNGKVIERNLTTSSAGGKQQRMMEHLNSYHLR